MIKCKYVFDDINDLINYLLFKKLDMTSLRLHKTLYFLYAYYGATYGQLNESNEQTGVYEGGYSYPKELFPVTFEAWKYGPVVSEVYSDSKTKENYRPCNWEPEDEFMQAVKRFVSYLLGELSELGDFDLVERSHIDEVWINSYKDSKKWTIKI